MSPSFPYIFVVDDDAPLREATALVARSFGWSTRTFACAEDCLQHLSAETPDCVVTDLNMPGMNGLELTQALALKAPALPVIIATGQSADAPLVLRARQSSARAVLLKPYGEAELIQGVETALGIAGAVSAAAPCASLL